MSFSESRKAAGAIFVFLSLMGSNILMAQADDDCSVVKYKFYWSGQIAGFIVNGHFGYDPTGIPANGIVREQDLSCALEHAASLVGDPAHDS